MNPIIEGYPSEQPMEVPHYVLDVRKLAEKLNGEKPQTKIFNLIAGTKEEGLKTEIRDRYEKACKISGVAPWGQIRERIRIPKTKISKQKSMTHKKISREQFNSFIDGGRGNQLIVQNRAIKQRNWRTVRSVAEDGMRKVIKMLKNAPKEEKVILKELLDLKEKEYGLICNYMAKKVGIDSH